MEEEKKDQEIHPVVELVVRRLGSNPEEYRAWRAEMDKITHYTTQAEKELIKNALRTAAMDDAHKAAMEKILVKDEPEGTEVVKYSATRKLWTTYKPVLRSTPVRQKHREGTKGWMKKK